MTRRPLPAMLIVPALLLQGCLGPSGATGKTAGTAASAAQVSHSQKEYFDFQHFDTLAASIQDKPSADRAFGYFLDYAQGRGVLPYRTQSLSSGAALGRLEAREVRLRSAGATVQDLQADGMTPAALADTMSSASDGVHSRSVDEATIAYANEAVRANIPDIVPPPLQASDSIGPLEAAVIAYAIRTGDDGTVPAKLLLPLAAGETDKFLTALGGGSQQ